MQASRVSVTALTRVGLAACAALLCGCSSGPAPTKLMTYNMGERVIAGHLTYTVLDTQWFPQLGQGLDARVPQSRFLLVQMSAVNGGSEDAAVPNFTLIDDHGNTFEELSDGTNVPQWMGYLRSAHPADYVRGNVVFDVPPAHYKLRLGDASGEHDALVDLPLSFNSEAPDLGLPAAVPRRGVAAPVKR